MDILYLIGFSGISDFNLYKFLLTRKCPTPPKMMLQGDMIGLNYTQVKDLWDSDFIEECLRASLTPSPSV